MNQGLSNRQIAEKLFISLSTVKTHAHNIYEKTGTKSRYDLFHLVKKAPARLVLITDSVFPLLNKIEVRL